MPRRVAVLLIAALAVAVSVRAQRPGTAAPSVVFHFPASFDTSDLEIIVNLRGAYAPGIRGRPGVHDYPLETVYEGRVATALQAYAYRPGFGFALVEVDLRDGIRSRTIPMSLQPLGTVELRGRIDAGDVALSGLRVAPEYYAAWKCEFFEWMDCGIAPIELSAAPVASNGTFVVSVPDFAHDPALDRFGPGKKSLFGIFGQGWFNFRVSNASRSTEYSLASDDRHGVRVADSYPAEVRFTIQK